MSHINKQAFFTFVQSGLWEKTVWSSAFEQKDLKEVYRIAEEQSIVGLVAAGLELAKDNRTPKNELLTFVGTALQLEQRNRSMNAFIAQLMAALQAIGISAVLIKGQGIAQCYERPLWRACGDVDLLLDEENYYKAKRYLSTISQDIEQEDVERLHIGFTVQQWLVELHGTLRNRLGKRMDCVIDEVQHDTFINNRFRIWKNETAEILLPAPDSDAIFVFTHILDHFFRGGIGLRQICDWCRLLWTYREQLDEELLEKRLAKAGLMTEWKAFAALAVCKLGMPVEAMPLYCSDKKWIGKAERILDLIMETGNFGHNRDKSYQQKYSRPIYKMISLCINTWDSMRQFIIFPKDAARAWMYRTKEGLVSLGK